MKEALRSYRPDWRTLVSAALIVLSFPPWNFAFLIWFALAPWLDAVARAPSWKAALREGAWQSFFMTLGGFYWVAYVLHEFGELPWAVAIFALLLFCTLGQPQFLVFGPILRWIFGPAARSGNSPLGSTPARFATLGFLVAMIYAGWDWIIPKLFVDTLGHAFHQSRDIRQVADLGGPALLTFLIFLSNFALWSGWRAYSSRKISEVVPTLAVAFIVCIAAFLYGHFRNLQIQRILAHPIAQAQIGVIQGNIGDIEKLASERGEISASNRVLKTYFDLSRQALTLDPKPEALVWPETSYPSDFRTPRTAGELARDREMEAFTRASGVPLLFGGYDYAEGKDFNAFFALLPNSSPDLLVYRKNILLLFGEYIPGAEQFQFLKDWFPQVGNFGRGKGPDVLDIPLSPQKRIKLSPVICYEALFPSYVLEAARKGSQMIMNITNDSWFGPTAEPELHLALISFRAIESRLPQLRATNTGISTLILPDGEVVQRTEVFRPEILNATVPVYPPIPTLMLAWGDWFGFTALALGLAGLGLLWIGESRSRLWQ